MARVQGLVSKESRGAGKKLKAGFTNQKTYWERFGVTQSGGSRYESGRAIPMSIALLRQLHEDKVITDADLAKAKTKIEAKVKKAASKAAK